MMYYPSGNKTTTLLFAPLQDVGYGEGVYGTCTPPNLFGSKEAIVLNNFNVGKHKGTSKYERKLTGNLPKVQYCIPIMVSVEKVIRPQKNRKGKSARTGDILIIRETIENDQGESEVTDIRSMKLSKVVT